MVEVSYRLPAMARKARPPGEKPRPRLNVEFYPEDEAVVRRAKAAAALRGMAFREWVLAALDEQAARDGLARRTDGR
jgi:hypothetical protein